MPAKTNNKSSSSTTTLVTLFWNALFWMSDNPLFFILLFANFVRLVNAHGDSHSDSQNQNDKLTAHYIPVNEFTQLHVSNLAALEGLQITAHEIQDIALLDAMHYDQETHKAIINEAPAEEINGLLREMQNENIDVNFIFKSAVDNGFTLAKSKNQLNEYFSSVNKFYDVVLQTNNSIAIAHQFQAAYHISIQNYTQAYEHVQTAVKLEPSEDNQRLLGLATFLINPYNAYNEESTLEDPDHTHLIGKLLHFFTQRLFNRPLVTKDQNPINDLISYSLKPEWANISDPFYSKHYSDQILKDIEDNPDNFDHQARITQLTTALRIDPYNFNTVLAILENPRHSDPRLLLSLYRYAVLVASDNHYYKLTSQAQAQIFSGAMNFLEIYHQNFQSEWFTDPNFERGFVIALQRAYDENREKTAKYIEAYLRCEGIHLKKIIANEQSYQKVLELSGITALILIASINIFNTETAKDFFVLVKRMAVGLVKMPLMLSLKLASKITGRFATQPPTSVVTSQTYIADLTIFQDAYIHGIDQHYLYKTMITDSSELEHIKPFLNDLENLILKKSQQCLDESLPTPNTSKSLNEIIGQQLLAIRQLTQVANQDTQALIDKHHQKLAESAYQKIKSVIDNINILNYVSGNLAKLTNENMTITNQIKEIVRFQRAVKLMNDELIHIVSAITSDSTDNKYNNFKNLAYFIKKSLDPFTNELKAAILESHQSLQEFEVAYAEKLHKEELRKEHSSSKPAKEPKKSNESVKIKNNSNNKNQNMEPEKSDKAAPLEKEKKQPPKKAAPPTKPPSNFGQNTFFAKPDQQSGSSAAIKPTKSTISNNNNNSSTNDNNHSPTNSPTYSKDDIEQNEHLKRLVSLYKNIDKALNQLSDRSTIESEPLAFYGLLGNLMWFYYTVHSAAHRFSSINEVITPKQAAKIKNIILYNRKNYYTAANISELVNITKNLMGKIHQFMTNFTKIDDKLFAERIARFIDANQINKKSKLNHEMVASHIRARISHLKNVLNAEPDTTDFELRSIAQCYILTTIFEDIRDSTAGIKHTLSRELNELVKTDILAEDLATLRNATRHIKRNKISITTGNIVFNIENSLETLFNKASEMAQNLFSDEKQLGKFDKLLSAILESKPGKGKSKFFKPQRESNPDKSDSNNNTNNFDSNNNNNPEESTGSTETTGTTGPKVNKL